MKNNIALIGTLLVLSGMMRGDAQGQALWIETTQEDFKDGSYERNLYSSHRGGGAVEFVPRFDLNNDGFIDIMTSNTGSVTIYWGSPTGYSFLNRSVLPAPSWAGNCDAGDLNVDGYAELVVKRDDIQLIIFWGSPTGPVPSDTTELPGLGPEGQACFVADLNKDGYLDIAIDQFQDGSGRIYWGSATGYDVSLHTDLPVEVGGSNIEIGDLNQDGWLDIIFNDLPEYPIYWGSPSGFSSGNRTTLPALDLAGAHGLSIADLNDDGYLDIVTTGWYDPRSRIFWGSASGYSVGNAQILNPGYNLGGNTVADINKDGYLDIVYHHVGFGAAPQKIYWGSQTGYSDTNTSEAGIPLETSGGFVADFNFDGNLDIFVNGDLGPESYVFWGPDFITLTALPVNTDRVGTFREIGNVYTREYEETYISSVFDGGGLIDWGTISWVDSLPDGSAITMQVRSGNISIPDPSWSSWVTLSNGDAIPDFLNAQYIQYQVIFTYSNPSNLPFLFEVVIDTSTGIEECDPIEPPQHRTQGYWRRQCKDDPHEDICAYVDSVHGLADHFDSYDCSAICALMEVDPPENDMCRKAERQFMALLLNLASGKLAVCNCLVDGREVGDVIAEIDSLLENFSDHATCERAKTLADDINTGVSIVNCNSRKKREVEADENPSPIPNPFAFGTVIRYEVKSVEGSESVNVPVTLKVYDITGRIVKVLVNQKQGKGYYEIPWNAINEIGERVRSGIYFYRVEVGSSQWSGKIVLIQ